MSYETPSYFDDNIPAAIQPSLHISQPNEMIEVYKGDLTLSSEFSTIALTGHLKYKWLPSIEVYFECSTNDPSIFEFHHKANTSNYQFQIDGLVIGKCLISSTTKHNKNSIYTISGIMEFETVLGDINVPVDFAQFVIPNLRSFEGKGIKYVNENSTKYIPGRLIFDHGDYEITIDKRMDFDDYFKKLKSDGGYITTYLG